MVFFKVFKVEPFQMGSINQGHCFFDVFVVSFRIPSVARRCVGAIPNIAFTKHQIQNIGIWKTTRGKYGQIINAPFAPKARPLSHLLGMYYLRDSRWHSGLGLDVERKVFENDRDLHAPWVETPPTLK